MSYNGQHQDPPIPRPTSSGRIMLDHNAGSNGINESSAGPSNAHYHHSHHLNQPGVFYPQYTGYGYPHAQSQVPYNGYYQQQPQNYAQSFYGPSYYNTPAPAPFSSAPGFQKFEQAESAAFSLSHEPPSHNESYQTEGKEDTDRSETKPVEKAGNGAVEANTTDPPINSAKREEEKVQIQGTSITLASDEDIKKWREERRKMWLMKISNQREKHKLELGMQEEQPSKQPSFQNAKKDQQFIQNIQNQIGRYNSSPNLSLNLVQRTMAEENAKLLNFIKELGDAKLLEYELNDEEKEKLFGNNKRGRPRNEYNKRFASARNGPSRYDGNTKKQRFQQPSDKGV
ncbi:LAFA_0G20164g1_1 [Lachancea sp. 'fantastica']|nr:LAFA_0G20164g1_1 [Lachancea sp. 'fantastica']